MATCLIGVDFGSESARGVLVDAATGAILGSAVHPYRQGVITGLLPAGAALPPSWALQDPADYLVAAEAILGTLGRGRIVAGIGIDFTASSPLPTTADGTPLSAHHPGQPHAYVKLWKHRAAQPWADRISAAGGRFLDDVGGRLSGNSLTAKAAEMAAEAPALWAETRRFIEAGDWLVWQLTGVEARSLSFAAFKALYSLDTGYPAGLVEGLDDKVSPPHLVGTPAGPLSSDWRRRTGILGPATVAVAMIDGHVVAPAVGAMTPGVLIGALGTSACYLLMDDAARALPPGIEGVARDATLPGLRCFEAGQGAFGDTLAWFARTFPRGPSLGATLDAYTEEARHLTPAAGRVVALDWWNGCRVPHGDSLLSGLVAGLTMDTTAAHLFRALLDSLCFGTRTVLDALSAGAPVHRIVMTSGLSLHSPLLMQIMADVLGRPIEVPQQPHLTALGAAIHGAVAAGISPDFDAAAARFGVKRWRRYEPEVATTAVYDDMYAVYGRLRDDAALRDGMHALRRLAV